MPEPAPPNSTRRPRALHDALRAAAAWRRATEGDSNDAEFEAAADMADAIAALNKDALILDAATTEHLRALIAYNWNDELADARENGADEANTFRRLVALDNALRGTEVSVEEYLREAA